MKRAAQGAPDHNRSPAFLHAPQRGRLAFSSVSRRAVRVAEHQLTAKVMRCPLERAQQLVRHGHRRDAVRPSAFRRCLAATARRTMSRPGKGFHNLPPSAISRPSAPRSSPASRLERSPCGARRRMGGAENRSAHSQRPPARLFFGVPAARVKRDGCGCRRRRCGSRERDGERRSERFRSERLVTRPFLFLALEAERPLSGGARFGLTDADEVLIGRGPRRQCSRDRSGGKRLLSVTVNSTYLSSVHARLSDEPQGWTIEDLNSRNGVFVNGQQVTRAVLSPGDVVASGRVFFLVEFHEVPESSGAWPGRRRPRHRQHQARRAWPSHIAARARGPTERLRFEAIRSSAVTVVGGDGNRQGGRRARDPSFRAAGAGTWAINCADFRAS